MSQIFTDSCFLFPLAAYGTACACICAYVRVCQGWGDAGLDLCVPTSILLPGCQAPGIFPECPLWFVV